MIPPKDFFENSKLQTEKLNSFSQDLIPYYNENLEINDLEKTAEIGTVSLSRAYIKNPETPALLVHQAVKNLLSNRFVNYEPETIWVELERLGLDIPEVNRVKLMTLNAIQATDPIIYDAAVFKNIVLSLNDEIPNTDIMEEVEPEQIAWALLTIQIFRPEKPIYMDYSPITYVATVLHRAGYILAPEQLEFAQEDLDRLNQNPELKTEIEKHLNKNSQESDIEVINNQLVLLNRIKEYVILRYKEYKKKLDALLDPVEIGQKVASELKKRKLLGERATAFIEPGDKVCLGSIRGDEKSGTEDPTKGGSVDYVPPVFVLRVTGA